MEQLTWPMGSNGSQPHPFSCIFPVDHGLEEHQSDQGLVNTGFPHGQPRSADPCDLQQNQVISGEHFSGNSSSSYGKEKARHLNMTVKTSNERARHLCSEHSILPDNIPSYLDVSSSRRSSGHNVSPDLQRLSSIGEKDTRLKAIYFSKRSLTMSCWLPTQERTDDSRADFSSLPFDILLRIAGSFSWPNLWFTSRVCRSWNQALAPLREAMLYVHLGKKFKHGRGGVARNLDKALEWFLKGAFRGCAAAMVDAGLLLWEMGRRCEGMDWYRRAAELGDPAGQCNLGLALLQEPSNPAEAVKYFHRAALAGHLRAQCSLALCFQQGRGVEASPSKAACWYLKAAEGGNARAMHNVALCYSKGEGMPRNRREARRWMKHAALAGHRKAQYDYGLTLFSEGDGGYALVFLELATRAGETAATHLRDALLEELSPKMRAHAIACADKWQMEHNLHS
eukprot:c29121_g1_i1 orf=381-1739(+)